MLLNHPEKDEENKRRKAQYSSGSVENADFPSKVGAYNGGILRYTP